VYLTAQRVRSRNSSVAGSGATGISVDYYRHGDDMLPRLSTGVPDLARISTTTPGKLVSSASDVPPGGNEVLSWLDVAAPDHLMPDELQQHLVAIEGQVATATLPKTWADGYVAISLSVRGVVGEPARHEFVALKNRLLAHLQATLYPTSHDPFIASLTPHAEAFELQWQPATKLRLTELRIAAGRSIRISFDVAEQFAASSLPGPLLAHALAAIVDVDLHELVIRGGVRVVYEGRTVWERLPG
jgi:hypothetical protein